VARRYLGTGLLLLVALATLILLPRDDRPPDDGPLPRTGIGYYLDEAQLITTGADGAISYRLRAASAQQDLASGNIALDAVELRYDPESAAAWQLRADHGTVPADDRIIWLSGDVVAISSHDQELPTAIRTDYLELDSEAYIASTDREVLIERPGGTIRARGLRFHLRDDRLELLAEVQGYFERP